MGKKPEKCVLQTTKYFLGVYKKKKRTWFANEPRYFYSWFCLFFADSAAVFLFKKPLIRKTEVVAKPRKPRNHETTKKGGFFWEETRQTLVINQKLYFCGLKANHECLCFRGLSTYHWRYIFGLQRTKEL